MSDDSKDPKSVFDAETVIWPIGDKNLKKTDPEPTAPLTEVTKKAKTRSKINIFDDDSTVRARPENKFQMPKISFDFITKIPWSNLKKNFGLPVAGLALGMILFFGASQYLKSKTPVSEIEGKRESEKVTQAAKTSVQSEVVRTDSVVEVSAAAPVKKEVAAARAPEKKITTLATPNSLKSNVAEMRTVKTTDEFLANLSQALQDSRRSATRP